MLKNKRRLIVSNCYRAEILLRFPRTNDTKYNKPVQHRSKMNLINQDDDFTTGQNILYKDSQKEEIVSLVPRGWIAIEGGNE